MSYRVTIFGPDYDAMADLVRRYRIAVFGNTVRDLGENGYSVDAFVDEEQIRQLENDRYGVERLEDFHARDAERFADVGEGNRYADRPDGPDRPGRGRVG